MTRFSGTALCPGRKSASATAPSNASPNGGSPDASGISPLDEAGTLDDTTCSCQDIAMAAVSIPSSELKSFSCIEESARNEAYINCSGSAFSSLPSLNTSVGGMCRSFDSESASERGRVEMLAFCNSAFLTCEVQSLIKSSNKTVIAVPGGWTTAFEDAGALARSFQCWIILWLTN